MGGHTLHKASPVTSGSHCSGPTADPGHPWMVSVDGLAMTGHPRIPRMAWPSSLK